MFDPVMADLDRYLSRQESAERMWEQTCEWILAGDHVGYFDDEEMEQALVRIANDGETEPGDGSLWEMAEAVYLDSISPY
jgi:hypothetical protein